jgi:hypothetical protein
MKRLTYKAYLIAGALALCGGAYGQTTVTLNPNHDAYVDSNSPSANFNNTLLNVGLPPGEFQPTYRTFIRFDLANIPSNAVVNSASLRLNLQSFSGTGALAVEARLVLATWSETSITWNNQPARSSTVTTTTSVGTTIGIFYNFTLTSLVQSWVNGTFANHGVALQAQNEATASQTRTFASRSHATTSIRPQLVITYTLPTPPNAPSNLTATAVSTNQINLTWQDNSNDEFGFKIERKTGAGGAYSQVDTVKAGATSYNNIGLLASTTYLYRVRAYNAAGNSAYSNEANATTFNPVPLLTSISPTIGTRLQTLNVVFTGRDFISGVTSVNVGSGITVNSTTVNSSTSLTANITITAAAATGARSFSVTNSGPGGGTSGSQTFTVNNPAPTLTSLSPNSGNRLQTLNVTFTGTNFISGISSVSFGADITVNSTTVNSATQITANITIGANAALGARNVSVTNAAPGGGTATLTNGFTVSGPTIPTAPSNLAAEAISKNEINLGWLDNSNNEDGFRIERRTGVEEVIFFTVGPNVTNYRDRGLNPGTRATYRVFAFNGGGDSSPSNSAAEITATGLLGDVVRDFTLDAQDVSLVVDIILQRAAQRITALDRSTADTNFDEKINVIDVVYIVREATRNLLASTSLPVNTDENDASGELRLGAATLLAGATAKLSVNISLLEKATALQLKLRYDSEKIVVDDPILSAARPGMALFAARDKNQLAVLIYSLSGEGIPAGAYKLLEVPVRTREVDFTEVGLQIENMLLVGEQRKLLPPRVINEAAKLKINLPTAFALSQNYPNPLAASNRQTEIGYTLPVAAAVKLSIYNLLGHEVAVLVNAPQTPGVKKIIWDGRDKQGNRVATGIYFYRLEAGNFVATRKMVLK